MRTHFATFNLGHIDCKNVCCGIEMRNYKCTVNGGLITHFTDWGWYQPDGVGGAWEINSLRVTQWSQSDPEFTDRSNFTAKGAWIDGNDAHYNECSFSWCLYPLYIDNNAISNSFNNTHVFQGNATVGPVPVDPICIYNDCTNANYFYDCYYDNGYVYYIKYGMVIQGGMYIKNANTNITEPWIRVFNTVDGASPLKLRISNIRASVGFYDGVGVFPGDFSVINAISSSALLGNATYVKRQDLIICPNNGTLPIERFLKPVDDIVFTYQIGTSTEQNLTYSATQETHTTPIFNITNNTGTVPHILQFGGGSVGISESVAGTLTFSNGGGEKWKVATGTAGNFLPSSDNASDIGSSVARVKNVHAINSKVYPSTTETLSTNGSIGFKWIDDTHFMFMQRGSDGVTRTVTITTA